MRRSAIILALLLAAFASAAAAAGWRLVSTDAEVREEVGRSSAAFVDYESLRRDGARVSFWMMIVTEVAGQSGMDNARAMIEADCPPGRFRYVERIFQSGEEILGRTGATENEQARPGTTAAAVIGAACSGVPAGSTVVEHPNRLGQEHLRALRARSGK